MDKSSIAQLICGELPAGELTAEEWVEVLKRVIDIMKPLKYLPMEPLDTALHLYFPDHDIPPNQKNMNFPDGITAKTRILFLAELDGLSKTEFISKSIKHGQKEKISSLLFITQKAEWLLCNFSHHYNTTRWKKIVKVEFIFINENDLSCIFKYPRDTCRYILNNLQMLINKDIVLRKKRLLEQEKKQQKITLINNLISPLIGANIDLFT
ncbi:MAG: hypothetical protein V1867_07155 [Candidatus Falkowbacteria bacterium]